MNKKQKKNHIKKIKQHLSFQKKKKDVEEADVPKGVVIGAPIASAKGK